jgi:hypothetical protein
MAIRIHITFFTTICILMFVCMAHAGEVTVASSDSVSITQQTAIDGTVLAFSGGKVRGENGQGAVNQVDFNSQGNQN